MAKTANLYARIEPEVKDRAESILNVLGIPVSNAINMFYKQIILQGGLPFEVKLPAFLGTGMDQTISDVQESYRSIGLEIIHLREYIVPIWGTLG